MRTYLIIAIAFVTLAGVAAFASIGDFKRESISHSSTGGRGVDDVSPLYVYIAQFSDRGMTQNVVDITKKSGESKTGVARLHEPAQDIKLAFAESLTEDPLCTLVKDCNGVTDTKGPRCTASPDCTKDCNGVTEGPGCTASPDCTPEPKMTAIVPEKGIINMDTDVVITGENFLEGAEVLVGDFSATNVVVIGSFWIVATIPAGMEPITYDVMVFNPDGQEAILPKAFSVQPKPAEPIELELFAIAPDVVVNNSPADIIMVGNDFMDGAKVLFGDVAAISVHVMSSTRIAATIPAGLTPGVYDVTLINPTGFLAALPLAIGVKEGAEIATAVVCPLVTQKPICPDDTGADWTSNWFLACTEGFDWFYRCTNFKCTGEDKCTYYSACTNVAWCTDGDYGECTSYEGCTGSQGCTAGAGCTAAWLYCTDGKHCTESETCTAADGCTAGANCTSGNYCTAEGGCTSSMGCTSGLACTVGKGSDCTGGAVCTEGENCTAGAKCTGGAGCTEGNDCTKDFDCTNGNGCTKGDGCTKGRTCTLGQDCTKGYRCTDGDNCTKGEACTRGTRCTDGPSCPKEHDNRQASIRNMINGVDYAFLFTLMFPAAFLVAHRPRKPNR